MRIITGGVTAPAGFLASGTACGLKKDGEKDLAIIYTEKEAYASGVFTTNVIKGSSLKLTMENIKDGRVHAVIINSGNANACVGEAGYHDAVEMASISAGLLKCSEKGVLVGSTGVIGKRLNMEAVRKGIRDGVSKLSISGGHEAEEAIMTTDLLPKETAVEFITGGKPVRIGAMAKGSGMIHPNMATMISIITTDAVINRELLDKALKESVKHTFNRVTVDGDTSVCDMALILANGQAGNTAIETEDEGYKAFKAALDNVCTFLSRLIAKDGEGATKLVEIIANGVVNEEDAYKIVSAIAKSPLVKTAIFGEDANWGRIITAAGYSGAIFDPDKVDIYIGGLMVCRNGAALDFDEGKAKEKLKEKEVRIIIDLKSGSFSDRIWTCDFSYDYVKINGSYRS